MKDADSSSYSEWNADEKWSSQEWKSGEVLGARTARSVDDKFVIDEDMDSDTVTESNLSLKSRSFLNRDLYSWERITQKTYVPSKNTGKDLT